MSALVAAGKSQFIVATHSPILLTFPGAQILSFDGETLRPAALEDVDSNARFGVSGLRAAPTVARGGHIMFVRVRLMLVGGLFLLLLTSPLSLTAQPQAKPQSWTAESIHWDKVNADGTKDALLEGRRDAPGQAFTYAFFIPAGYWEHHWHSADARVTVVQGELRVAFGDALDKDHATGYGVGSYLFVPKNVQHTMGATVDTIIVGTAVGPWATHHHDHGDHGDHH